jgi:hypothetical protein
MAQRVIGEFLQRTRAAVVVELCILVLSAERFYGSLSDPAGRMTSPNANGKRAAAVVIPIARSA